jgi:glyoxylase-like metal-dependent hydrolase (beta-lactamase superfamily II)
MSGPRAPSDPPEVQELDERLYLLDLGFQGIAGIVGSYLIADAEGRDLTLVDTGPASGVQTLIERIRQAGYDPSAIRTVLLTHIHLDHSGGAGALLELIGPARVVVHPRGARHLIDPSKLLASAGRIYGDRMHRLWGVTVPVVESSIEIAEDGAELTVSGRTMVAYHTPGHASHHIAYLDRAREAIFTGDVGGVRIRDTRYIVAPTPPPDIDIPAWSDSIDRLRALRPRRLYLAHYGVADDPRSHLDSLEARLMETTAWLRDRIAGGADPATLGPELGDQVRAECSRIAGREAGGALADAYELAGPSWMNVDGLRRYLATREASQTEGIPR